MNISEADFAEQAGAPRDLVRQIRQKDLREGEDWLRQGRDVYLTPGGAVKLMGLLIPPHVSKASGSASQQAEAVKIGDQLTPIEQTSPDAVTLRVRHVVKNPRMILATDGQAVLRVRVADSKNFLPGMAIRCRHIQADLYELATACPRSRGRW